MNKILVAILAVLLFSPTFGFAAETSTAASSTGRNAGQTAPAAAQNKVAKKEAPQPEAPDLTKARLTRALNYVIILALFAFLPGVIDTIAAYWSRYAMLKRVSEKALNGKEVHKDLAALLKEVEQAPPGIVGLSRATMALTVILILGIAVFHILVVGLPVGEAGTAVNNVLSMLGGLLAAITGFYFGAKKEEKEEKKESKSKG